MASAKQITALTLPDPEHASLDVIRQGCRAIYDHRDRYIETLDLKSADLYRRQAKAIETFVGNKQGGDDVRRSARVLECAVGAALGKSDGPGRPPKISQARDISGLTPDDRYRCRLIYTHRAVWEPELEKRGLSQSQVLTLIKRHVRRTDAVSAAKAITADVDRTIVHASFVDLDLADASVDLIFTDPPYHDKTLPIYKDMGKVAARVLKDEGSLITYTSHHRMPEVIQMLQEAGLRFFWPLAMVHTGQKARMTEYGIVVHWKPLLWFVKGKFRSRDDMRFVNDLINSAPEKDAHPWQQGTAEAKYYIEALTHPGDLVFDPFCGGGTTAVAAAQTLRRWLTCDVDEEAVWIARKRLREAVGK